MSVLFHSLRVHSLRASLLAMLACAVMLGGIGSATAAGKAGSALGGAAARAALQGAISGTEAGLRALQLYLAEASGHYFDLTGSPPIAIFDAHRTGQGKG
jgi:hypothetical protein